jgi:hypothetical protein
MQKSQIFKNTPELLRKMSIKLIQETINTSNRDKTYYVNISYHIAVRYSTWE